MRLRFYLAILILCTGSIGIVHTLPTLSEASISDSVIVHVQDADPPQVRWGEGDPFESSGGALLVVALLGMVGALAGELVEAREEPRFAPSVRKQTLAEGAGKLFVGLVAAFLSISLNPPSTWFQLIGASLLAGIAGEAIVAAVKSKTELKTKDGELQAVKAQIQLLEVGQQLGRSLGSIESRKREAEEQEEIPQISYGLEALVGINPLEHDLRSPLSPAP